VAKNPYGVRAIGVNDIPTESLRPNPHNPRLLFDKDDLSILKQSIEHVGILVPLTVYRDSRTQNYVILDGQRRWMCAQEVGLETVPINEVAEPNLVQNIVTMFQIHKLRSDWELMPTALKLELLMQELQERRDKVLAELTGLDVAVVTRCKKLLSYPKKYQDMMLDADPAKRVKADFFIELYAVLSDREVKKFDWFKREKFTGDMLIKQKKGGIKAVTDFRVVKQHIVNAVKARKWSQISKRLKEFAENPEYTTEHLNVQSAQVHALARRLVQSAEKLYSEVSELDVDELYGEELLWDRLKSLMILIEKKLRLLGRRVDK
jgi:ParB family chromosome partitioning protein